MSDKATAKRPWKTPVAEIFGHPFDPTRLGRMFSACGRGGIMLLQEAAPPWSDKRSLKAKHAENAAQTKAPVSPGLAQPFTETVAEHHDARGASACWLLLTLTLASERIGPFFCRLVRGAAHGAGLSLLGVTGLLG